MELTQIPMRKGNPIEFQIELMKGLKVNVVSGG